ncbi:hypothetical protein J7643_04775 [bacterium]|nr:hypothetical protein [bacterium]
MFRTLIPTAVAAVTVAFACPALAAPAMTDQVMLWQTYQLEPGPDRHDLVVYYTKQFWITPQLGVYTFYNTGQSATVRAMYKLDLGDTGISGTLTGGLRFTGMGSGLAKASAGFKEGPEAGLTLAKAFGGGFSVSALGSYARLWEANAGPTATPNTGEPTNLVFYGLNLNQKLAPATTLSLGVLGAFMHGAWTDKLKFHDLGPTLSLTQSF